MTRHLALMPLPELLADMGFNVLALHGWDTAQGRYFWTDPDTADNLDFDGPPSGYMVHHTAGAVSRPVVKSTSGKWSKANAWIGLSDDGGRTLTQNGGGAPYIVLTSAGPARTSSGYGYRPAAWDFTFKDLRGPPRAQGSDGSTALNRYVFNVETTHRGDGSAIDPGVWSAVVGCGQALHAMFGWDDRTIGHRGWTARKIDPRWAVGLPNDGNDCIIDIQDAVATGGPPPPPNERPTVYLPLRESDGYDSNPARREDVKWLQRALNRTERAPGLTVDGKYGPGTSLAVHDLMTGGDGTVYGWDEHDALLLAAYGGDDGPGGPHTHPIGPSVPT